MVSPSLSLKRRDGSGFAVTELGTAGSGAVPVLATAYNEQGTTRNCPSRCSLIFLCCLKVREFKKTWTHSTPSAALRFNFLGSGILEASICSALRFNFLGSGILEASICLDPDIPKQTCTDHVSHVNRRVLILIRQIDWVVVAHFNRDSLDKKLEKIPLLDLQIRMLVSNCISFQFL
jgi:hypothetical protein